MRVNGRDAGEAADGGAVLDGDVPGEPRVVDHDDVVARRTQSWATWLVAMTRQCAPIAVSVALVRRAVDGHVLADHGVVADAHADAACRRGT